MTTIHGEHEPQDAFVPRDAYDLKRFIDAQQPIYDRIVISLRKGSLHPGHMAVIFPRLCTGGRSAGRYAIASLDEASAYLQCPTLGGRYRECVGILQRLGPLCAQAAFGGSRARHLRASLTLFSEASRQEFLLESLFEAWFDGLVDEDTVRELRRLA